LWPVAPGRQVHGNRAARLAQPGQSQAVLGAAGRGRRAPVSGLWQKSVLTMCARRSGRRARAGGRPRARHGRAARGPDGHGGARGGRGLRAGQRRGQGRAARVCARPVRGRLRRVRPRHVRAGGRLSQGAARRCLQGLGDGGMPARGLSARSQPPGCCSGAAARLFAGRCLREARGTSCKGCANSFRQRSACSRMEHHRRGSCAA